MQASTAFCRIFRVESDLPFGTGTNNVHWLLWLQFCWTLQHPFGVVFAKLSEPSPSVSCSIEISSFTSKLIVWWFEDGILKAWAIGCCFWSARVPPFNNQMTGHSGRGSGSEASGSLGCNKGSSSWVVDSFIRFTLSSVLGSGVRNSAFKPAQTFLVLDPIVVDLCYDNLHHSNVSPLAYGTSYYSLALHIVPWIQRQ